MAERAQSEEMRRAAHEFSEAVDRFVEHVNRLELIVPKPAASDHEADSIALKAVHYVREQTGRKVDAPAPRAPEVREWEKEREAARSRRANDERGT